MDAGVIIAIVVGVLILVALFALLGRKSRDRKHEARRDQAREIRREAEVRSAEADQMSAEAEERAARARREEAAARAQSAKAQEHHREAEHHHARAHEVDPDAEGEYRGSTGDPNRTAVGGDTRDDRFTGDATNRDVAGDADGRGREGVVDDEYRERRIVREGDPNDPDAVREEQVHGQRRDR